MNKIKKLTICLCAAAVLILTALSALFSLGGDSAKVYAAGPYDHQFSKYHITYDINSARTMVVTVDMAVDYLGYASTGLMYDI
ncbi:MAG: hypothetical protein K2O67_04500, partial [Clostridia bacterium]|nr:hypothetical protein [Clostridia bacterium]